MASYRTFGAVLLVATGIVALPAALALRKGAEPGYSGGPGGGGQNCTLCHLFDEGSGHVQLLGTPQRYRPGAVYDLAVRVSDSAQKGAGFEISVEGTAGYEGDLLVLDAAHTGFANPDYVTHTRNGVEDSIANWAANGESYQYILGWRAPAVDVGPITFFTAGLAINDALATGDHFYGDHATIEFAHPGDSDGDGDADLVDFAALQRCFSGGAAPTGGECEYVDSDDDGIVSLDDLGAWVNIETGPTAASPAGFVLADAVRGGALYDRWWAVNGAPKPTGDHPLYPDAGQQTGSATFRCSECHGWDYKGRDGVYGSGSHFTGVGGVLGTALPPQRIFDLLKADPASTSNGHNMYAYGMSDRDLWDVVKFTTQSVVDTGNYITPGGAFIGDQYMGGYLYSVVCSSCHGEDGKFLNFGTPQTPAYIGTAANNNPWQFLHRIRFGQPGSSMPATDLLRWSVQDAAGIGAYSATLPQ